MRESRWGRDERTEACGRIKDWVSYGKVVESSADDTKKRRKRIQRRGKRCPPGRGLRQVILILFGKLHTLAARCNAITRVHVLHLERNTGTHQR